MKKVFLLSAFMLVSLVGFSQLDKMKALMIYHASIQTKFPGAKASGDYVIGVNSSPGVFKILTALSKSKKIQGRTIVVKNIAGAGDAASCNLVFVPTDQVGAFKASCVSSNTILYTEGEGSCASGAHFSFFVGSDKKPKFEVSESNMKGAGLTPGAKILAMGKKV